MSNSIKKRSTETNVSKAPESHNFSLALSKFEAKHIFGNIEGKTFQSEYAFLCAPPVQKWHNKFHLLKSTYYFSTRKFSVMRDQLVSNQSLDSEFQVLDEYNKEPEICYLPLTLLPDLVIEEMINNIDGFQSVPVNLRYNAVLLVLDVSGFTPLTEMYNRNEITGTDELAADLNNFMSNLASSIMSFGGDILSFAGDAYLCQWEASREKDIDALSEKVFQCAVFIQTMPQDTDISRMLRVKIGIALGETTTLILGSPSEFLLFVIAGGVLVDVQAAEELCGPGEIVVTEDVYHCLKARDVEVYKTTYLPEGFVKISSIPNDVELSFPNTCINRLKLFGECGPRQMAISRAFITPVLSDVKTKDQLNYLSEVSRITILFILLPKIEVTHATNLDFALQIILLCVQKYEGVLNKVLLFDKGCTFLAIFGLPGVKHLNDASRAISCADLAIQELEKLHKLEATTGISSGMCFCGMVGHSQRQEYTVIGWRVNMACRLMTTYPEVPIVLDADTYHLCCSELGENCFTELEKRKLKGIKTVPDIYAYHRSRSTSVPRISLLPERDMCDITRTEYYMESLLFSLKDSLKILKIQQKLQLPVITIQGPAGSGRSYTLYHAVEIAHHSDYQILAFHANESYVQKPFRSVCKILRHFLKLYTQKGSSWFETMKNFIPMEDPFAFVLNHLLETRYPVPNKLTLTIEVIYREIGRLLKLIFQQLYSSSRPLLIAIDAADCMDFYSWQLLFSLVNDENVILLLSLPLDYLPSCSAAAMICEKTYYDIKFDKLNESLVAPLICWFLNVDAVHEDIVEIFKEYCENDSQMLEELTMMPFFSSFIQIVPKSDINPDVLEKVFLINESPTCDTGSLEPNTPKVCDMSTNVPQVFDSFNCQEGVKRCINTLGIQNRVVLKRAAVLGFTFTRNMLSIVNWSLSDQELDNSIDTLLQQKVLNLVCDSGCCSDPNLLTKKHPSVIRVITEYAEISTKVISPQSLFGKGSTKHAQKMQFISSSFRNNILRHMTKDQRTSMRVQVAKLLEKEGLICINCAQGINEYLSKGRSDSENSDTSIFANESSLQLVPLDLRKCNCLEYRTKTYELISSIYEDTGMLLLPIKFLVKASEICIHNNNPIQAFSYIEHCFKIFPKQHILERYELCNDEMDFIPAVLKASLYRMKAEVLFLLNNIYDAAANAMKAISILGINVVDFMGADTGYELRCILQSCCVAQLKEISQCLSILCLTYLSTSEFRIAYQLAIDNERIISQTESSFIENIRTQCLIYRCKIKAMPPMTNFEPLEEAILKTCHERLMFGTFPLDILDIKGIAQAYIAIITHNLYQRYLDRAEKTCREIYRVMKCIHETVFTPRILSLAIEACLHSRQSKPLSIYLSHLRSYAMECNSEVYMALFYCGTIRYTNIQRGSATKIQMDLLGQCEEFMDKICVHNIPLYFPQNIFYFIAANLALWCLEAKPIRSKKSASNIFLRWYQFAQKQKFKSFDSYWHMSAELIMIRIDLIIQFQIKNDPINIKRKQYKRIIGDLQEMKLPIKLRYPVLERTWRDLIEELGYIWPEIYLNQRGRFFSFLENCLYLLKTDMISFVSE